MYRNYAKLRRILLFIDKNCWVGGINSNKQTLSESYEFVMIFVMSFNYRKYYLHSNYGIYEEKHGNKKTDIRESLVEKKQEIQFIKTSCNLL